MRITPLDVRKQEFRRVVRGADPDEVQAFLATVADEYEAVLTDNKQLREKVIEFDQKLAEYRNMERTLRDTLLTAERVMTEARQNARKEAELILRDAQLRASQATSNIENRVDALRSQLRELRGQRDALLARMQSLSEAQIGLVSSFRKDFASDDQRSERLLRDPDRHDVGAAATAPASVPHVHEDAPSDDVEVASAGHAGGSSDDDRVRSFETRGESASHTVVAGTTPASPVTAHDPDDHWRGYDLARRAATSAPSRSDDDPIDLRDLGATDDEDVSAEWKPVPSGAYHAAGFAGQDDVDGAVDEVLAIHDSAMAQVPDGDDLFETPSGAVPPVSASGGHGASPVPTYSSPEPTDSVRMQAGAAGADPIVGPEGTSADGAPEDANGREESRWSLARFKRGLAGL